MSAYPSEFVLNEVFVSPLLVAALIGVIAAWITARLFNRFRLSRFFWYPPLVFLAMAIIYTGLVSTFVIRG